MRRRIVEASREGSHSCGQASVEYLVVTAVIVYMLLHGGEASYFSQLMTAFKSFYRAYSFALSLP